MHQNGILQMQDMVLVRAPCEGAVYSDFPAYSARHALLQSSPRHHEAARSAEPELPGLLSAGYHVLRAGRGMLSGVAEGTAR